MRRRNVTPKTQDESVKLIQTHTNDTHKPEKTNDYRNGYRKQWIEALVDYTP